MWVYVVIMADNMIHIIMLSQVLYTLRRRRVSRIIIIFVHRYCAWDYLTCCLIVSLMFDDNEMILAPAQRTELLFLCLIYACVETWSLKLIFRDTSPSKLLKSNFIKTRENFYSAKTGFMKWPIYLSAR